MWGIILAAGLSRRMGTAKLLLPYKNEPIIYHVIRHALNSSLSGVTIVVNSHLFPILNEEKKMNGAKVVVNDEASIGMSESVKVGIESIPSDVDAVMFLLGDQPLLSAVEIDFVLHDYERHQKKIVQATYQNKRGHPVLFDKQYFCDLRLIQGDEGGRSIVKKYKEQVYYTETGKEPIQDIDTKSDYERLLREEVS
ncbi:nucleotidyltransferase family protein [Halalkalibacter kiskunsagensis]|uniref:Nucleotidyltransferase family protein n=1 Tax=Halalkalibacter kiskunsagensis TaxID=1548599 RepID=A0ABV6KD36_9BACI